MEQINAGILKLMNLSGSAHVNGTKYDPGAKREEPVFDVLLEQKSNQSRNESAAEKPANRPAEEKDTKQESVKSEKAPAAGREEEEMCDVAREAACAQIVWLTNPNTRELLITRQENVATIEQPVFIGEITGAAEVVGEAAASQIVSDVPATGEIVVQDELAVPEAELMPGQAVETVQGHELPEPETNVSGQKPEEPTLEPTPEPTLEVDVTKTEGEETGGEAAAAPLFEDVEAAPIKVAEAPERAEAAPEVEKQVAEKLTNALGSGETKVEIQLEPVELGKLTIELTQSEDGTLNILMSAENAQTRGLLERHMGGLQEALAERGQQNVQITVNQGEESQRQENNDQRNDFQDGSNGRQSEQRRRDNQPTGDDFLQQLRLGLIPIEEEEE